MNFLKLTMIDTPSPRDADASKKRYKFSSIDNFIEFNHEK